MRVLLTRPSDDAAPLACRLEGAGHEVRHAPMLEIEYLDAPSPDLSAYQAVLLTSANGARALGRRIGREKAALPVFAVGNATADAAREAGFAEVESAAGDVAALADMVAERSDPAGGPLLQIAGSDVAGDLAGLLGAEGFTVARSVLYRATQASALPVPVARAIRNGEIDAVLFFSPRTAEAFVRLVEETGVAVPCRDIEAHCLSQAVADKAGRLAWAAVRIAARPAQDALLALLKDASAE